MTDKQIKLDGSWIPIEVAIKAGLVSEKDINVPSKRLDRIDKMETDLANYEQMERDIEKIIEPYQLDLELDCLSLPTAIQSILERKEQECERLKEENFTFEQLIKEIEKYGAIEEIIQQLDQLKAEVKSKTEYTQEQRDIINQYSKEIEMYKKCQGKRASKREEELKAENDNIKETFDGLFKVQYKLADNNKKLRQTLTEIKEIAEKCCIMQAILDCENYDDCTQCGRISDGEGIQQILQKISEVEND